jgi:Tetratricopeptide repeat
VVRAQDPFIGGQGLLVQADRLIGAARGLPGALTAASNLATIVRHRGKYQAARELGEDTLARRVLGEDHPDTLTSAFILAAALFELGEYQGARELNEDILARRRRVLGEDHPDTGASATFAIFLHTPRMLLKTIRWHSRRRHAG